MKILLVNPPLTSFYGDFPPLGLMNIASVLEKNDFEVMIFDRHDLSYSEYIEEFQRCLGWFNPELVAFSCYIGDVDDVRKMCTIAKPRKTIVGGFHPSMYPEQFCGYADHVVIGEGEFAVLDIAFGTKRDFIVKCDELVDMQYVPSPAYHLVDMKHYTKASDGRIRGVLVNAGMIFTSRGCPFHCTFCPMTRFLGMKPRFRKASDVVDEIEMLMKEYHINAVQFLDESFTINKRHTIEICKEIKRRGVKVMWGCYTRVDLINDELLKVMKSAGCVQIDFGVESGSNRVLKMLRKGITTQQVKDAFDICRRNGIRTFANYLTNVPGETIEEREMTISFANEIRADRFTYNIFLPYPNTEINQKCGIEIDEKDYREFFVGRNKTLRFFSENYNFTEDKKDLDELFEEANKRIKQGTVIPFLFTVGYWKSVLIGGRVMEYLGWCVGKMRRVLGKV